MSQVAFTSVSQWIYNKAVIAPITSKKKNYLVLNGVNIDKFKYRNSVDKIANHKFNGKKILLHVTANFSSSINDLKGGFYIFELAKRLMGTDFVIMIIGNNNDEGFLDNMISIGKIYDSELLSEYYSMAELTLLTSSRETFSMPTIESLCCGTPVLGFNAGGPESIAIKEYSEFVQYGNLEKLIERIIFWTKIENKVDKSLISKSAHSIYSRDLMTKNYMKVYRDLTCK
jgi:glycosyltransferase involved in cell wall biosynthesis